jgi:hypothetical protein
MIKLSFVFFWGKSSVADLDPGSGAFLTLDPDPGSGIGFFPDPGSWISDPGSRILDLGSRIPTPYFLELSDKFLGKKFYNSLKTGPNFFLQHLKNKIIFNFVKFVATKKGLTTNFFHPSLLLLFWIWDPRSGLGKNQNPGSRINIPDPQHWEKRRKTNIFVPQLSKIYHCYLRAPKNLTLF